MVGWLFLLFFSFVLYDYGDHGTVFDLIYSFTLSSYSPFFGQHLMIQPYIYDNQHRQITLWFTTWSINNGFHLHFCFSFEERCNVYCGAMLSLVVPTEAIGLCFMIPLATYLSRV
jgi:hypothetical protein